MNSTGITRLLDPLGRIVLPAELRRTMNIRERDSLAFYVDEEKKQIILKKYNGDACIFCGKVKENITYFKNKLICFDCIKDMPQELQQEKDGFITNELKMDIRENEEKNVIFPISMSLETSEIKRRKNRKGEESLMRLVDVLRRNPSLKQVQMAKLVGVSTPYVNIMIKELKARGVWQSIQAASGDSENNEKG
ncbi:AbrB/MazE/SpoVT family DNA-binding domain-containing protein [Brevibacillus sp. NPDC058079]|uniref:AbrB/MazE/SpoVT family DNA-binding domain-containing protein n=1 Tax=Brevibacillus sp. NPDC058079 TaxID=3346330 RepID=UPI0036EBD150